MRMERTKRILNTLVLTLAFFGLALPASASEEGIIFRLKSNDAPAGYGSSAIYSAGELLYLGGGGDDFSGREECGFETDTLAYDPILNCFVPRDAFNNCGGLMHASGASARGQIFLLGGRNDFYPAQGGNGLRSVHRFDPATNEWDFEIAESPLECGLMGTSVVEYGGDLYVFGGDNDCPRDEQEEEWTLDTAFLFDPSENSWKELESMPNHRAAFQGGNGGAFVVGDEIWIVGGSAYGSTARGEDELPIDVYDPATDSWKESRQAPPISGFTAMRGDNLYIFSWDGEEAYEYSSYDDEWFSIPVSLSFPYDGQGRDYYGELIDVTVCNGKFYATYELYEDGRGCGRPRTYLFEGSVVGTGDARVSISPGDTIVAATQRLNILFAAELFDSIEDGRRIEWSRLLIDGKDRTKGLLERGIGGKLREGGDTMRFPNRPKAIATRIGPGTHRVELEVRVNGVRYGTSATWRCIENDED